MSRPIVVVVVEPRVTRLNPFLLLRRHPEAQTQVLLYHHV